MGHERIEMNPEIMGGKPVVRGTRVPVELVLRKLGSGMTPEALRTANLLCSVRSLSISSWANPQGYGVV